MTAEEETAAAVLQDLVMKGDEAFQDMCQARHQMGEKKYGPVKFMSVDSIEMALEEVADLANYARYTFIKLYMVREQVSAMVDQLASTEPVVIGPNSFTRAGEGLK